MENAIAREGTYASPATSHEGEKFSHDLGLTLLPGSQEPPFNDGGLKKTKEQPDDSPNGELQRNGNSRSRDGIRGQFEDLQRGTAELQLSRRRRSLLPPTLRESLINSSPTEKCFQHPACTIDQDAFVHESTLPKTSQQICAKASHCSAQNTLSKPVFPAQYSSSLPGTPSATCATKSPNRQLQGAYKTLVSDEDSPAPKRRRISRSCSRPRTLSISRHPSNLSSENRDRDIGLHKGHEDKLPDKVVVSTFRGRQKHFLEDSSYELSPACKSPITHKNNCTCAAPSLSSNSSESSRFHSGSDVSECIQGASSLISSVVTESGFPRQLALDKNLRRSARIAKVTDLSRSTVVTSSKGTSASNLDTANTQSGNFSLPSDDLHLALPHGLDELGIVLERIGQKSVARQSTRSARERKSPTPLFPRGLTIGTSGKRSSTTQIDHTTTPATRFLEVCLSCPTSISTLQLPVFDSIHLQQPRYRTSFGDSCDFAKDNRSILPKARSFSTGDLLPTSEPLHFNTGLHLGPSRSARPSLLPNTTHFGSQQSNSKPVRPRATSVPSLRIRTLDAEMEHSSSPVYGHQRFVLDHLHNTNLGFDNPMVPSLSSSSNESSNGFVSHGAGGSDHTLLAQQHHIENQVLKQQVQSVADYCRRVQIKNNQLEHKVKNLVKERDHHKAQSHHWNAVNPAIGKSKAQLFMENGQLMMETIRRMGMEANVKDEQLKSKTEQSKRWEQKAKFLLDLMQKNVPKRQTTAEVLEAHLGRSSNHMENSSISTYQQPGDTVVSRTNLPLANSASTNLLAVNATPFSSERQLQTHASTTHLRSPGKQDQVLPEVSTPISHGPIIHEIPSSPEANPAPVDLSKKPLLWLTQNGGTHPCSPNFGYGHSQVSKNNTASKRARFDPNSSPLDCEAPAPTKKGRELQQRRLQSWEKKKAIHLEREARKKDREVKKAQKDEARKAQKAKNFKPKDVSANTPNQESYTNEGSNDDDFTMHFDAAVAEMEAEEDHGNEEDNRENDMTIEQDLNEHLTKQLAEMDAENHSKATSVEHGAHENHYPGYDMSLPAIDNAFNAALQGRSAAATLATESENTPQLTNAESPEDNDLDSLFEGSDAPNDEEPVSNNQAVVSSNSQDAAVTYPTTGIANQFGATESENTPQLTNAESPEDNDLDSLFEGSDAPNDEEPVSNSQAVVSSNSQDAAVTYPTTGIADQFGATMIDNGFEASDCELFDFDKFLADADESGINFPMFDEI